MLIRKRKHIPSNKILILWRPSNGFLEDISIPLYDCIVFIGNVFNAPFEKITA